MKDQLVFDTTDSGTIADSDSIGAYLRGSSVGTIITHSSCTKDLSAVFTFTDGNVSAGADVINITHQLETGEIVRFSNSGGALPGGLSAGTDFFVIRVDTTNFSVATSLANAEAGTVVDITSAAGGGTHTTTP